VSRRSLLQGAGAAALAAILSHCGVPTKEGATGLPRQYPPTLTPTDVARTVASTGPPSTVAPTPPLPPALAGEVDAFESPLESPLATPGPEASPTPAPSATPTPLATPFPAGPPSKLGLFVAWYHPQIMDLISTRNVALLKTLELDPNFLADVKARSPETIIVGRALLRQLDLSQVDPLAAARSAVEAILPLALDERRKGLVDAWEGHNEPVASDEGQMRKLGELEAERVRLLARHGLRAVVGNFGTGQPPLEWWPAFRPAIEAAVAHGGYLGLHEYSAPTIWFNTNRAPFDFGAARSDEGWLTLRYRKVYGQYLLPWGLGLPLLMTECGIDGMVTDRPGPPGRGWKDFGGYWAELGMGRNAPGKYVEQLAWYDSQLHLDDYVQGAAIFVMTGFQEWDSYQILGEAAGILEQYFSVRPLRLGRARPR
jgi:hypothetical protein